VKATTPSNRVHRAHGSQTISKTAKLSLVEIVLNLEEVEILFKSRVQEKLIAQMAKTSTISTLKERWQMDSLVQAR